MPITSASHRPRAARLQPLLDRIGIGASVVCLVHCLVTPFVLTGLAAAGAHEAAHHGFHAVVLALALPLALASAWPGYREHRRRHVLVLLGAGVALLGGAFLVHDVLGEAGHIALTVLGSLLLLWGHVRNYRLRARCASHVLPHHAAHHDHADHA